MGLGLSAVLWPNHSTSVVFLCKSVANQNESNVMRGRTGSPTILIVADGGALRVVLNLCHQCGHCQAVMPERQLENGEPRRGDGGPLEGRTSFEIPALLYPRGFRRSCCTDHVKLTLLMNVH